MPVTKRAKKYHRVAIEDLDPNEVSNWEIAARLIRKGPLKKWSKGSRNGELLNLDLYGDCGSTIIDAR